MEFLTFYDKVFQYFSKKVPTREDALDLTQGVFEKVVANLPTVKKVNNVSHWIFKVSKNHLIDYYRRKSIQSKFTTSDFHQSADDTEFQNEIIKCQDHYMNQLDDETKYLLIESEIKGKSQKALAEEFGVSYSTIRSKIQRGRTKIRSIFLEKCYLEYDSAGRVTCCVDKDPEKKSC
ncbi:MAG TPA: sigma-70 family RNA polymerase sigma factor [Cyclobacteriaceae bacterium]|jgi:RNA polymerase sigma-70 factor (ECF subfamily)